jgi:ankyrin repeat protein
MLAKSRNLATLRRSLASLPQTLDQTYDRILTAIREEDRVYAIRILQWLTFSERPLTIEEVAEVAAIDIQSEPIFDRDEVLIDPLEALDICSSLITVTGSAEKRKNQDGRLADPRMLSLAHYSVQEYLVSDRIKLGPAKQYHMQEGESHEAIMKGCIGYLNQFLGPISPAQLDISALAMYSANFWISHFKKAGDENENICRLALSVFSKDNPVYYSWLRLSDPEVADLVEGPELERELDDMIKPLYYAARLGLSKITQLLLDQGADIDVHGVLRGNALLAALAGGHTTVAKLLINAGANLNINFIDWGTPLYQASRYGDEAMVKLLIDAGADVNAPMSIYSDWDNALQAAIETGGEATVKLLLEGGADCGLDERLRSPIHHALRSDECTPSLISILQQHGASIDAIDIGNMTPLHNCVLYSNQEAAKQLLDAGVPVNIGVRRKSWSWDGDTFSPVDHMDTVHPIPEPIAVGLTPLHFAALTGNLTMTKFFLDHGADPNALSEYGETPLHLNQRTTLFGTQCRDDWVDESYRVEYRSKSTLYRDVIDPTFSTATSARQRILDTLLAHPKTSTATQDCQEENLLHCIKYGKPESVTLVQKFLSRGADPSCVNSSLKSPLHLASEAGDTASIVALLSTGTKAVWTEECLLHALDHAVQNGDHSAIVAILETKEARAFKLVMMKDKYGQNLLHRLSWGQYIRIETVQWLLEQGTDGSELDHSGVFPLARLIQNHTWDSSIEEICRLLLEVTGNGSFVDCNGQGLGHLCAATPIFQIYMLKAFNDHGVDLASRDCAGRTVLHCATMSGFLTEESLEFLVNVIGIQANEEDAHGRTALQYAIEEASKKHDADIIYPERWERTRDILLKHHSDHKSRSSSSFARLF